MSKMRKEIQEQLQKDEVAETLQSIADNFRRHRNLLVTMVVVIVLAVLLTYGIRSHRASVQSDTNAMLAAAIQNYETLATQTDPKQREEIFKSVTASAGQLADSHPNSKLGREALYLRGKANYSMDRYAEAEKDYTAYLAKAQTDEERAKGAIALGYTFENGAYLTTDKTQQRNRLTQAMTQFERAATFAQGADKANPAYPYLYYYALICQGRLNELMGQEAKAIALYEEVRKSRPEPAPQSKTPENKPEQDTLTQLLRKQLEEAEGQLSFQAMAKTRLDRLKSAPKGPAQVTAETQAPAAATTATQTTKKP